MTKGLQEEDPSIDIKIETIKVEAELGYMWDVRYQESTECNLGHKFKNYHTRLGLLDLAGKKLTPFFDR
jgi:hypothetical protein